MIPRRAGRERSPSPRPGSDPKVLATLGFHPPLGVPVAQLQAQLGVAPRGLLDVHYPSFSAKEDVNSATRVSDPAYPAFRAGLSGPTGLEMVGRRIERKNPVGPSDRHAPVRQHSVDQLALTDRPWIFRRITSCNISRSSVRSATIFCRRVFSSSSCFSRRFSSSRARHTFSSS